MTSLLKDPLTNPLDLEIHAAQAEVITWRGREALRLEDGLALVPNHRVADASLAVQIGADEPAYPGIAFRVADALNFELAYAVPHVSGQWDALQYDPVFHGSNTWQVYHGPSYQGATQVPTGRWFRLKVDFSGARAAVSVDGQPPLVVERLAHPTATGLFGLWTYRPAYFCDLRVSTGDGLDIPQGEMPSAAEGTVEAWFVEGYGVVIRCGDLRTEWCDQPEPLPANLVGRRASDAALRDTGRGGDVRVWLQRCALPGDRRAGDLQRGEHFQRF
jgi:hypothetical protein